MLNIMYATNYQEEDTKALARLSLFAEPFQAQVHIVHMCHEKNLMEIYQQRRKLEY